MKDDRLQSVVDVFASLPDVKGIIGFGSWFTDAADGDSDVDLLVYCSPDVLSRSTRHRLLQDLAGMSGLDMDYFVDPDWWPAQDKFQLEGITFDLSYFPAERVSTIVRQVHEEGRTSVPALRRNAHVMLGLLERSVALHDPESLIDRLKAGLYPYPMKLRRSLLKRFLPSLGDGLRELDKIARRRIGPTAFLRQLAWLTSDLQECLYAINERYHPGTPRAERELAQLPTLPDDFLARYRRVLTGPFDPVGQRRAVDELARLVGETQVRAEGKG